MKAVKMSDRELSNSLNEIRILASLSNPYIVGYKEAFYDSTLKSFCLVTEFADGGDLSSRINSAKKSKTNIPEPYIWKLALQLLFGIRALHNMKIFHRDIKPANILLSKAEDCAKLADMNVSVISKTGMASTQTGTPAYASPEVWMEKPYSGKSDIWSLGCLIYEMAALKPPFMAGDLQGLKKCIIGSEYDPIPASYSKELQALVKMCLEKDQKVRPSAQEILNLSQIK